MIALNTINFVLIYLLFSSKKYAFFIPIWIKKSLRVFFPCLLILYFSSTLLKLNNQVFEAKINSKASNEDVYSLYYRYIKELSSKFIFSFNNILGIISEIQNENPNVEYIKNQLKEGEPNLDMKMKSKFENFTKYF